MYDYFWIYLYFRMLHNEQHSEHNYYVLAESSVPSTAYFVYLKILPGLWSDRTKQLNLSFEHDDVPFQYI